MNTSTTEHGESDPLVRLLVDALDRMPGAIALADASGRLMLCNTAFAQPYGTLPAGLVGLGRLPLARGFLAAVAQADGRTITGSDEDLAWWLRRLAHAGDAPVEVELLDGRWQQVSVSPIAGGGEAQVRTDITQRKQVEQLLRESEAVHRNEKLRALGGLLAAVAHEINNPLSVVLGQALLLQETAAEPRIVERAEKIRYAASRCSRIVHDFIDLARRPTLERSLLDPNEILEAGLEPCAGALAECGVRLIRRLAAQRPPVDGDRDQLAQVVTHLVLNACRALEGVQGAREIKLTSSYRGRSGEVVMKVKDNGPGIPQTARARLFEPLFTTREPAAGSGFGLALSHRIVAAHGGMLYLESAPGAGAVFCMRLPAAAGEPRASEAPAARCRDVGDGERA